MGKRIILFMTFVFSCAVMPLAIRAQALDEAETPPTAVESRVSRVLMYSDRALVLRDGEATLPAGRSRVVFEGLPERMADDSVTASIAVQGATTALAKIANIEVERVYETTFRDDEAKEANEELVKLQHEMRELQDRLSNVDADTEFANEIKIGTRPGGNPNEIRYLPLAPESWDMAMTYFGEEYKSAAERRRKLAEEVDDLQARIVVASARARMLLSYKTKVTKRVILEIASTAPVACDLGVSYMVSNAAWFPRYDVRADIEAGTVEIVGYALARQESGEDWESVEFAFSAAEPSQAADLPELMSWRIRAAEPVPVQKMSSMGKVSRLREAAGSSRQAMPGAANAPAYLRQQDQEAQLRDNLRGVEAMANQRAFVVMNQAPNIPGGSVLSNAGRIQKQLERVEQLNKGQEAARERGDWQTFRDVNGQLNRELMNLDSNAKGQLQMLYGANTLNLKIAERQLESQKLSRGLVPPVQSSRGYDYRWQALRPESVPSDGALTKVVLYRRTFPVEFVYEIAAEKAKMAFLKTTLENTTQSPFLAGPGSVFLGADFVGETAIKTCAPSQSIPVGLGADEAVFVERKVESKRDTRGLLSGTFRFNVASDVTVRNGKQRTIAVAVYDRMPATWDDELKISDATCTPRPTRTEPSRDRPALLCWEFDLPPGEKKNILLEYWYQHDSDRMVVFEEDPNTKW